MSRPQRRSASRPPPACPAERGPPPLLGLHQLQPRRKAFARWLHRAIETYRIPKSLVGTAAEFGPVPAKLRPAFRDKDELVGASELGPRLEAALAQSEALVVVCSPQSVRSAWVDKEIRTFKRMHPDRPVLAVIARGVPGDPANECFPEALCFPLAADGTVDRTRPVEPRAPDAQKLDRRAVRLKLIAGLLGVGYGALADCEHRRARARVAAVAGVSTILVIVLSLLSLAAFTYAPWRNASAPRRGCPRHGAAAHGWQSRPRPGYAR